MGVRSPRQGTDLTQHLWKMLKFDESRVIACLDFVAVFPAYRTRQATCFAQDMHHLNKPHIEDTNRGPGLQRLGFAPAGKQTERE